MDNIEITITEIAVKTLKITIRAYDYKGNHDNNDNNNVNNNCNTVFQYYFYKCKMLTVLSRVNTYMLTVYILLINKVIYKWAYLYIKT